MYAAQTVQREDMRRERRARALRKQREKRKMILLIVLTLVVIFVIGMGFGSMITRAKEPAAPAMYKTDRPRNQYVIRGENPQIGRASCRERV